MITFVGSALWELERRSKTSTTERGAMLFMSFPFSVLLLRRGAKGCQCELSSLASAWSAAFLRKSVKCQQLAERGRSIVTLKLTGSLERLLVQTFRKSVRVTIRRMRDYGECAALKRSLDSAFEKLTVFLFSLLAPCSGDWCRADERLGAGDLAG